LLKKTSAGGDAPSKLPIEGFGKLALASAAGKKGDYRRAVKILGELISESDPPAEAWLLLGRSLHALKNYSRALAAFNDYIKLKPRSREGYLFAGRTYLTLGMPYKAVPFLRKSLGHKPGDPETMALLGIAYLKSKHSQAAVDVLQGAVQTPGRTKLSSRENRRIYRAYLNALLVRGVRLCALDDYDMGLQMLRFVLENGVKAEGFPDSPFLRLELGRACRETGRMGEALEHYTKALEAAPDDRRIRWSRASILMALGKNSEALKEIDRIRRKEPGLPDLPWNSELVDLYMIRSFMETGEWRRAAATCRNLLRNRQESPLVHVLYAEALRNLRDFSSAHNHLLRALEKEPRELGSWYADILVSWEGRDWKALRKALREANARGGDADIIRRFSILLEAETSTDGKKNLALLQNAVRRLGPEPELMYALGSAYLKMGLLEEGQSWFQKTITLKPDHEKAWLGEIAALEAIAGQGQDGTAAAPAAGVRAASELEKLYTRYLEIWPDNHSIRRDRALFLIQICEYTEAAEELEKLLAWEPANPSLRRVLAYAYRKTGRYREAAVFLKALLKEKPKNLELLLEYSGCLERAGGASYAAAVLEKARELFKNSSDIALALGLLSFRQRKVETAFDYLREAAWLNRGDPRPYEWMAVIARKNGETGAVKEYEREAKRRKNRKK
jgi:tetratricopeptide (TPR) repeat protein